MAGDGFPGVEWIPAHTDRYAVKHSRKIDAIVLHITDGKALDARQTARNVFASPKELGADGKFRQQSSHYIIGRDGTVVQCVRHKDIAYYVNAEDATTIGIDPTTTHKDCPKRALDWNTHFQAIADVQALAQG
jgi:hypothetical protein